MLHISPITKVDIDYGAQCSACENIAQHKIFLTDVSFRLCAVCLFELKQGETLCMKHSANACCKQQMAAI